MKKILVKDHEWSLIDGEVCRVIDFTPLAKLENGKVSVSKMPYASVTLECSKLPQNTVGFIGHKLDFQHLWEAFIERGVKEGEEVVISWTKRPLRGFAKVFSAFMPRLWVAICRKGAYELITDQNCNPELTGEARFLAERPIVDWEPDVWK